MNHRSNMDYVLVAFLAAERAALSFAVGEWARIWPLQQLIRPWAPISCGAIPAIRSTAPCCSRYVQMASEAGVTQAVFPEGGLTMDGRLRAPKFGLLDYMLKTFDERPGGGTPRPGVHSRSASTTTACWRTAASCSSCIRKRRARALARRGNYHPASCCATWQMLAGGWHRFGYACVNFGTPLSMRAYARERGVHFPALDDAARNDAEVGQLAQAPDGRHRPRDSGAASARWWPAFCCGIRQMP
jgi:glycerol-3-phosphate O-acyltransferase